MERSPYSHILNPDFSPREFKNRQTYDDMPPTVYGRPNGRAYGVALHNRRLRFILDRNEGFRTMNQVGRNWRMTNEEFVEFLREVVHEVLVRPEGRVADFLNSLPQE